MLAKQKLCAQGMVVLVASRWDSSSVHVGNSPTWAELTWGISCKLGIPGQGGLRSFSEWILKRKQINILRGNLKD